MEAIHDKDICVVGDYNLNINKFNSETWHLRVLGEDLVNMCAENALEIVNCGPTYFHQDSDSILDYFLVSSRIKSVGKFEKFTVGFSDHDGVKVTIKNSVSTAPEKEKIRIRFRPKIENNGAVQTDMRRAMDDVMNIIRSRSIANYEEAEILTSTVMKIIEKHAPESVKFVKIRQSNSRPSKGTLKQIMIRNSAKNAYTKSKSSDERKILFLKYRKERNRVTSAIRKDKMAQVETDLARGTNAWKVSNKILDKTSQSSIELVEEGATIESDQDKANILNKHFISKVINLKKKIDPNQQQDPMEKLKRKMQDKHIKFSFQPVSYKTVKTVIKQMKTSKSTGTDNMSSEYLKMFCAEIVPALTQVINNSLLSGNFPDCYKVAKVTPIYKKKGEKTDKINYRPISGLSVFGKVQETIADMQMRSFCEKHNLFGVHQHGFRKSRSTQTALLSSYIKWKEAKSKKEWLGILMFDLSAAYDVLDTDILLKKAEICGFDIVALAWLKSYITNRVQCVKVGDALSEKVTLTCGIPQGSACSCLLFIMYCGDMPLWITMGSIQSFADDTLLFIEGESAASVISSLEKQSRLLFEFFASNNLVANAAKTAFMLVRPKCNDKPKYSIDIQGTYIEESESERVLGVQIRNDLKWQSQLAQVNKKLNYSLFTLKRLQPFLGKKHLNTIAQGIMMSHLRYCSAVYLHDKVRLKQQDATNKDMQQLQLKQNAMLRIILKKRQSQHVTIKSMLEETKNLSVNQLTCLSVLMETWKAIHLNVHGIKEHLHRDIKPVCLRSTSQNLLKVNEDLKSFPSKAAKMWNISSDRFKSTCLLKVAKAEAVKLVKTLPQ
jgi:hypothetical protein